MQLRGEGKLLEAQRLLARTKYDLEMMQEVGYLLRHRELQPPPRRPQARREAVHADRLLPQGLPAHHRRIARHHPADQGDVHRRPDAQGSARRARVPPAQRDGQPAAEVRGIRADVEPGGLRLRHAQQVRAGKNRRRSRRAGHPPDRPGRSGNRRPAPPRARCRTCWREIEQARRSRRAHAGHDAHQATGRRPLRLHPGGRLQGPLPAQRNPDARARGNSPRPAPGRLRRARRREPAARRASTCPKSRWSRSSTPTRPGSCAARRR